MKFFQKTPYHLVPSDEEGSSSSLDKDFSRPTDHETGTNKPGFRDRMRTLFLRPRLSIVALLACLLLWVPFMWILSTALGSPTLKVCLEHTSVYSPAFEAVELYDTDFANEFNSRNIYRGPPTPEREDAWRALWDRREVAIPPQEMARLNRSGDMLSEYLMEPMEKGSSYVGGLEVFHQLHCLNFIRQFSWYLMEKYNEQLMPADFKGGSLKEIRIHADHCIETLRLSLMCHSDVTPVLLKVDHLYDPPRFQADFNAHHRCRNFWKISAWNEEKGLETFGEELSHDYHHHN